MTAPDGSTTVPHALALAILATVAFTFPAMVAAPFVPVAARVPTGLGVAGGLVVLSLLMGLALTGRPGTHPPVSPPVDDH